MATSYISEHSAEYYLVPALKEILQEQYSHVAPLFPWMSRELSKLSRRLHKDDQFHVLVMFPRRPKLQDPKSSEIQVTINFELEAYNEVWKNNSVPVIAGCPRALDIWDLSNCQNYAWLDLTKNNPYKYLNTISQLKENGFLLEKSDILTLVRNSAVFNLESFEKLFRDAKETQPHRMYGSQYKPVYFLVRVH
ncbi:hypothetical protein [Aeromonas caviae]|uniref:hypothetical protein n=1 Tax=Aeromonas caviae TaxID=648 RepID=UPI002B48CA49|nr:hypothetical protein [Aeromonas caviae]